MKSTLLSTQNSFICPDWPSLPKGMRALSTTRRSGVSRAPTMTGKVVAVSTSASALVMILRRRPESCVLQSQLNSPVIFLSQIHGNIVIDAMSGIQVSKQTQLLVLSRGRFVRFKPPIVCPFFGFSQKWCCDWRCACRMAWFGQWRLAKHSTSHARAGARNLCVAGSGDWSRKVRSWC